MTTDLRSLDLHTLNIAIEAAANAVREKGIHWERQSISAAFTGELNEALTCKNWAFASSILATTVKTSLTELLIQVVDAKVADLLPTLASPAGNGSVAEVPVSKAA